MRLIGIDPGLQRTGWGVIEAQGNRLRLVAAGIVRSSAKETLAARLVALHDGLVAVIQAHQPREAAIEHTYVNKNPESTLKLGHARGIALMTPAKLGLAVAEYQAMVIKKSVVGYGHADKDQVAAMVARLLPGCEAYGHDAFDALAIAICHAHNRQTASVWMSSPELIHQNSPASCPLPSGGERVQATHFSPSPPLGGEGGVRGGIPQATPTRRRDANAGQHKGATPHARDMARDLRAAATEAEKILWGKLRGRGFASLKIRRQHPIGPYVVDFFVPEHLLVIELDGGQHADNPDDLLRTGDLERRGIRVLRFWNNQVFENIEGVLETILLVAGGGGEEFLQRAAAVSPPLTPPSPPRGGEGEAYQLGVGKGAHP